MKTAVALFFKNHRLSVTIFSPFQFYKKLNTYDNF